MKYSWFVFFIFLTVNTFGQKLDFEIIYQKQPIRQTANILLKQNGEIKEYTSINRGKGSYVLKNKYPNLLIEINVFGFKSAQYVLKNIKPNKNYNIKVILEKIEQLKKVLIFSRKKISERKDTITYDVKSFTRPTDVKVVDVLRRLPGIELDEETGKIKFNGKPIQTVLLDGDNLFDSNYTLGTKNINIKAIDKIQAIEHYSENPLLKRLVNGENTVLNLKLKKNITDLSGDLNISTGLNTDQKSETDAGATILGINRKIKSFGIINYNNMGNDYVPVDIFDKIKSNDDYKKNYYTFAPISTSIDKIPHIKNKYQNFNNQLFSTVSLLYKISKKTNIRTNLFYLSDQNSFDEILENSIQSVTNPIHFSSHTYQNFKPKLYRANIKIISKPSQKNYFTNVFNIDFSPKRFNAKITKNNTAQLTSLSNLKDNYISNLFDYTHLFNKKFAIHLLQQLDYNNITQSYSISNGIKQQSDNQAKTAFIKLEGVGLSHIFQKYHLGISGLFQTFEQKYKIFDNSIPNIAVHQNQYEYLKLAQSASLDYKLNDINIKPRYEVSYYNIVKQNRHLESVKINLKIAARYNFSLQNFISFSTGLTQKPLSIERFHSNFLYADFRTKLRYQTFFDFQQSKFAEIRYAYDHPYPILHIHTGISFRQNQGYLSPDFTRTENNSEITYRFYPKNQNQIFGYFSIDKYFSKIKSALTFKMNYAYINNQITSNLNREKIQINRYNISLSYSSAFNKIFNVTNTIKYTTNYNNFSFIYYWHDQLKLFFYLKKYTLTVSNRFNRYMHNELYRFSDIEIYRKLNKNMNIRLAAQNLFNNQKYKTIDASNDMLITKQIILQPRLFYVQLNMNF